MFGMGRSYVNVRGSGFSHTKTRSLRIFPSGSLRAAADGPILVPRIYEEGRMMVLHLVWVGLLQPLAELTLLRLWAGLLGRPA